MNDRIRKWLATNWVFLLSGGVVLSISFFQVFGLIYPYFYPFMALLIISVFIREYQNRKYDRIVTTNAKLSDSLATSAEQLNHVTEILQSKEGHITILNRLIKEGAVSKDELIKKLKSFPIYQVICYAKPYPSFQMKKGTKKEKIKLPDELKRLYPSFLEDRGFVRVGKRGVVFITTNVRLSGSLLGLGNLVRFLEDNIDDVLRKEWDWFISVLLKKALKSKKYKAYFEKYKDAVYSDFMGIKIMVTETVSAHFIQRDLPVEIPVTYLDRLFLEQINLKKLIKPLYKLQVRDIINTTSISYLVTGMNRDEIDSLEKEEASLREILGVENIFDYRKIPLERLKEEMLNYFSEEKAHLVSKSITEGANRLYKAFVELDLAF